MNAPTGTTLGQRVRAARQAAGLTQLGLAVLAGVNVNTILRIESGSSLRPHTTTLAQLARPLGVSRAWLRTGDDDAPGAP